MTPAPAWIDAFEEVLDRYEDQVYYLHEVQMTDEACPPHNTAVAEGHVGWMIDQMRRPDFWEVPRPVDRAMRWLCFIQGVLWYGGHFTVDEYRDDNRRLLALEDELC